MIAENVTIEPAFAGAAGTALGVHRVTTVPVVITAGVLPRGRPSTTAAAAAAGRVASPVV